MRMGFIGDILRWILDTVYRGVPNYGLAVILFTIIIRILLMPLDLKSKRSMARMSLVQPKIEELNKKYKDDKQKLTQKQQELYKKEKINPLAGCLPLLLSMPILFSMFAVMREVGNEQTVQMILRVRNQIVEGGAAIGEVDPEYQSFLWIKNVFQPDSIMSAVVPDAVRIPEQTPNEGEEIEDIDAWRAKKEKDWLDGHALSGIGPSGTEVSSVSAEQIEAARAFMATEAYEEWAKSENGDVRFSMNFLMWPISIPEHFNGWLILPLLAFLSQTLMTKLTPGMQPNASNKGKSESAKSSGAMMKIMFPLLSVFFCLTSSAGFALYWVSGNIIQAAQQYGIGKWIAYTDAKKVAGEEATRI